MPENKLKGILFAVLTALCWSVVTIALKIVLQETDPFTIVWFRFTLAFGLLVIYFLVTHPRKLKILKRPPAFLIFAALGLAGNYYGIIKGVDFTTPTTTQLVIQFGPILLGVSGFLIYKEKISLRHIIGFLVAISGLYLFYHHQTGEIVSEISAFNTGVRWILFAAITWAVYSVFQKQLVRKHSVYELNLVIYGLPALLYTPTANFGILSELSSISWVLLIFLGINTLLAYVFMALALKHVEANKVSIILVMNPVITFLVMKLLVSIQIPGLAAEQFTLFSLIGAVMVMAGAAAVVGYRKNKVKKIQTTR